MSTRSTRNKCSSLVVFLPQCDVRSTGTTIKAKEWKTFTFESAHEQRTNMWTIILKPFMAAEEATYYLIYHLKWCHWLSWIVGKRPVMKNSPLVQHHTLLTLLDFVINTWNQNRIQQNNTCRLFIIFSFSKMHPDYPQCTERHLWRQFSRCRSNIVNIYTFTSWFSLYVPLKSYLNLWSSVCVCVCVCVCAG